MLMKTLVANFASQLNEATQIGEKAEFTAPVNEIRNILVTGLGGSGIGGTIIAQVAEKELQVPLNVCKDYFIPGYVNKHTLVIVSSYSGNTEETLQALHSAIEKNAKIVCVTSGGKILEIAKAQKLDHIIIPGGMPPRACLAYSFTQLFYVLHGYKLIGDSFKAQLKKSVTLLQAEEESMMKSARSLAEKLVNKIPVIYAAANYEGVATRFRQQVDENSKMLCWHHVLPEMNHNELVGWTEKHEELAIVMFRNNDDYGRTQRRMEITREVISKYTPNFYEVWSKGDSQVEKSFYLIHFGDWVSWYLSELKNIDATEVNVIDYLKGSLSTVK
jgi:glucose/mannose-6-phosphate isomerase